MAQFAVKTKERFELVSIDRQVQDIISDAKVNGGLAHIFVPHATCGLVLNEDESKLKQDYLRIFKFISQLGPFAHDQVDDNASAHLLASIFGQSLTIPLESGKLVKGAWQQIMLAEFDGPRERKVIITTLNALS